jgi:hypothetical protein
MDTLPPQKLEKVIPDQPANSTPVHLRQTQVFAHAWIPRGFKPFIPGQAEEKSEPKVESKAESA